MNVFVFMEVIGCVHYGAITQYMIISRSYRQYYPGGMADRRGVLGENI